MTTITTAAAAIGVSTFIRRGRLTDPAALRSAA
jgi:hypothetical protein